MWAHHTAHHCCLQEESDAPAEQGSDAAAEQGSDVLLPPLVLQAKRGGADGGRAVLPVLA